MAHRDSPFDPVAVDPADSGPAQRTRSASSAAPRSGRRFSTRLFVQEEIGITAVLIALVVVIGVFHPTFLARGALLGTVRSAAFVALIAFGMVFLVAMTELDLSVGSVFGFSALVSGELMAHGMPPWLALVTGPVTGMCLEAFNAVIANSFRIPVIIVTLGTLSAFQGLATVVTNSQAVNGLPLTSSFFRILGGSVLGVPASVWVVLIVGSVLAVTFRRTPFGARVRAIGSNDVAARFSGIRISRTRLQVLLLVGALCGLSGVLALAYFQGADPTLGGGLELQVIAATIIGGTAVSGGTGTVPGALIGALVIATITSGLVYFSIGPNWSGVVTGGTVVVAVSADGALRRRRARRLAHVGI